MDKGNAKIIAKNQHEPKKNLFKRVWKLINPLVSKTSSIPVKIIAPRSQNEYIGLFV